MKKITLSFALFLLGTLIGSAQLRWLETKHDFGAFAEDLAAVDANFRFINEGDKSVRVLDARATCGCTQPQVTKGDIKPGDTCSVKVTYLATGRPGRFSKNVYIKTSDNPHKQHVLTISGVVIGSNASLNSRYPESAGKLKLETKSLAFGEVKHGKIKSAFIEGYNQSNDTLRPQIIGLPDYVDYKLTPEAVPPGEQVLLTFTLQTLRNPEWGISTADFSLIPNEGEDTVAMDLFTIITEDFDKLTPGQRLNAPIAELSPMRNDLGSISRDANPINLEFEIKNSGKSPLIIRRVQVVDPSLLQVKLQSEKIKPGKTAKLTMVLDPSLAESDFVNAHISLITNDPENSLLVGRLTAEITR